MATDDLVALAKRIAGLHALDPALVCAVCEQESGDRKPDPANGREGWNPWAIRMEPDFGARYVAKLHLGPTESVARSISWGVMQVLGEVAREHAYSGHLAALCDPETGIEVGCTVLSYKLALAQHDVRRALLLYNGGGNSAYPDQVLARVARYQ